MAAGNWAGLAAVVSQPCSFFVTVCFCREEKHPRLAEEPRPEAAWRWCDPTVGVTCPGHSHHSCPDPGGCSSCFQGGKSWGARSGGDVFQARKERSKRALSVLDGLRAGESTEWHRELWGYKQKVEDWTKQMAEFEQEPGNWNWLLALLHLGSYL